MKKLNRFDASLRVSLVEVLASFNFYMAALIVFCALIVECSEDVLQALRHDMSGVVFGAADKFNISIKVGYYIYAAPLAGAFAASGNIVSDLEAGFYRLRLMKSGRNAYAYGVFVGSTLGGGLALMLGVLLFAFACAGLYDVSIPVNEIAAVDAWLPVLTSPHANWAYMLLHALLALLFGMIWSGIGLTISLYSPNRYVSYLAPFIVCFCTVLVLPVNVQPLEMLVQINWTSFTFPKLLCYQAVLYALVMAWFKYAFERRVVHEQG